MATLRIDVDQDTLDRLARAAVAERRPIVMHAEVVLRRALGLPFPIGEVNGPDMRESRTGSPQGDADAVA